MHRLSEPKFRRLDVFFGFALKIFEPKETRSQFLLNFCIFIIKFFTKLLKFFIDLYPVSNFVNEMGYYLCFYETF